MQQPDISQVLALLRSPAGQQLLEYLNKNGSSIAQSAAAQASAGDFSNAQKTISPLLENPELQAILRKLGGMP